MLLIPCFVQKYLFTEIMAETENVKYQLQRVGRRREQGIARFPNRWQEIAVNGLQ
jgi:hypothetical protein